MKDRRELETRILTAYGEIIRVMEQEDLLSDGAQIFQISEDGYFPTLKISLKPEHKFAWMEVLKT